MLVMILEKSPESLRGELSRWLIQLRPGIFLGNPSRRVRDELWVKARKKVKDEGYVVQIWTAPNEQGYEFRQYGLVSERFLLDYEGLALVVTCKRPGRKGRSTAEGSSEIPFSPEPGQSAE